MHAHTRAHAYNSCRQSGREVVRQAERQPSRQANRQEGWKTTNLRTQADSPGKSLKTEKLFSACVPSRSTFVLKGALLITLNNSVPFNSTTLCIAAAAAAAAAAGMNFIIYFGSTHGDYEPFTVTSHFWSRALPGQD